MIETLEKPSTEPSTELTVQARAALALASDRNRQDLMAMATRYLTITEIKNSAGRAECHSAAMTLASARIAISKTGKAARDEATKFSKAVIQEEASLIAITEPEEKRLLALRDGWDEAVAAEKAAKEAAERARIVAIRDRIVAIRDYVPLAAGCRTAARVDQLLTKLSLTSLADFEEFADEAAAAHVDAMERVIAIFDEKTEQEAEQARIKAEQAAAAQKLAAERADFEAQQAAAKAWADKLAADNAAKAAAERAQFEASQAAAKALADADFAAQRDALAAQQAAAKEAADKAKAEQEATAKRNRDAAIEEADRLATERQRLDDERKAFETQVAEASRVAAQAEADRIEAQLELDKPTAQETVSDSAPALAVHAQDAIETEASISDPSDADLMWTAIRAVAKEYGWTTEKATTHLAAVQWTL